MNIFKKLEPILISIVAVLWMYSLIQYYFVPESHTFSLGMAFAFSSLWLFQLATDKSNLKWWFMGRKTAEECLKDYMDNHPTCLVINVGYVLKFEKKNKGANTIVKSNASDEAVYTDYKLIKKIITAIDQCNIKPLNFRDDYTFASVFVYGVHTLYMNLYFSCEEDRAAFEFFLNGMPD